MERQPGRSAAVAQFGRVGCFGASQSFGLRRQASWLKVWRGDGCNFSATERAHKRNGGQIDAECMTDDVMQATLATWAAKNLPARLDVAATAKLLGFAENDIQILMAVGKLTPLGDPAPNAPKWFSAVEMIRLAADQDWLHKATKEISKYWRNKRERRINPINS
jgi:hypothetical protein